MRCEDGSFPNSLRLCFVPLRLAAERPSALATVRVLSLDAPGYAALAFAADDAPLGIVPLLSRLFQQRERISER
jgi:hypothetical protein